MVIGAFPAAKLGALLLKQISKPIANVVKHQAKSSPFFRKYVCMPPAHFYNWCEVKTKMWILNLGRPVNIPVLNEDMAIELGANLLGEGIIFLIAAGILINEYTRSVAKENAKEAARKQEMENILNDIRDLYIETEEVRAQIRELFRKLGDQDTKLQKMGIHSDRNKPTPASDPPPYSPVNDDPNLTEIGNADPKPPELYQLSCNRYSDTNGSLVLRAVDEIQNEFWNFSYQDNSNSLIVIALYYLNNVVFKRTT